MCTPFKEDPRDRDVVSPEASCDPSMPFDPPMLVQGLSDALTTVESLRLSPDELTAYFSATGRTDMVGYVGYNDIYTATRETPSSPFHNIAPILGSGINTPDEELDPTVSGDGLTLVFARGRPMADPVDLHYARRAFTSLPFTDVALFPNVNDSSARYHAFPFLREDGEILYFASANVDLYWARREGLGSDAGYTTPMPITELNIGGFSQIAPVVTLDGGTIYYATDRNDGGAQGDYDIWMATRASPSDPFSVPVNVKALNSWSFDIPTFVNRNGCTLYFSSGRENSRLTYAATRRRAIAAAD
jgi:hypothetical protein